MYLNSKFVVWYNLKKINQNIQYAIYTVDFSKTIKIKYC